MFTEDNSAPTVTYSRHAIMKPTEQFVAEQKITLTLVLKRSTFHRFK